MKFLLAILVALNLHAITVVDILGERRVDELLKENRSEDYIRNLAIEEYKRMKGMNGSIKKQELNLPKEEEKSMKSMEMEMLQTKGLNDYCYDDLNILSSKGSINYLDLCISMKNEYNKKVVHNVVIDTLSSKNSEELLTLKGKEMLKEDLMHKLHTKEIFLSKFTIKEYNNLVEVLRVK